MKWRGDELETRAQTARDNRRRAQTDGAEKGGYWWESVCSIAHRALLERLGGLASFVGPRTASTVFCEVGAARGGTERATRVAVVWPHTARER